MSILCRPLNIFYVDIQEDHKGVASDSKSIASDTLLLLHGFPTSSADFNGPVLDSLRHEYGRIIALDYPGASSAAILTGQADEEGRIILQSENYCSCCALCSGNSSTVSMTWRLF